MRGLSERLLVSSPNSGDGPEFTLKSFLDGNESANKEAC